MVSNRRVFLMAVATAGPSAALMTQSAHAQVMVNEKDPQAVALGYVSDVAKVDKKKYPRYADGQLCNNCSLYQGKVSDAAAGCTLFAGKQVPGKAWCNAWVKKA